MRRVFISCIVITLLLIQSGLTDIPKTMSYQGLLTNASGTPVADGNYSLTFKLYSTDVDGSALWTETHPSVAVIKGIFNVILGSSGSPLNLPFDQQYWLGVTVGAGLELTPRIRLTSAAYSLNAQNVADDAITTIKLADNAVTTAKVQSDVVSSVDGVSNDGGNIDLIAQNAVTITSNDSANTVTIGENHSVKTNNPHSTTASQIGAWSFIGNADTNPATNFLGTTDNQPLELRVNNVRILRLEPNATSPNIIGGSNTNSVTLGVVGAVITGGGTGSDIHINLVTDNYGTVGGGAGNQAGDNAGGIDDASYNTVGGGHYNKASGLYAFIGGGQSNEASDLYTTVGGGANNKATNNSATVGGGQGNEADYSATVSGGVGNEASAYATVSGGEYNKASSSHATISGGRSNEASGNYSTISGGRYNKASAIYATIGGGGTSVQGDTSTANLVTDDYGTVSGGGNNQAGDADDDTTDKTYATVGGGQNNEASGAYATVPGGSDNVAKGSYSFAAGRRAKANYGGCFVWGDSTDEDITASGPNRFMVRSIGGVWFYSNSAKTTGVRLPGGDSAWTTVSDRALKENIYPVDGREILGKLTQIPISRWSYKGQNPEHIGPMAQDFYAAFGLGDDERYISTIDPDGVALAAIQGLYEMVQEKDEKITEQESRIIQLEERLKTLESLILQNTQE